MQRAGLHAGRVEGAANGPLTRSPPQTDALSDRDFGLPCGEPKCAITRGCAEPPLGAVTVVVAFEKRRIGRTANLGVRARLGVCWITEFLYLVDAHAIGSSGAGRVAGATETALNRATNLAASAI